MVLIPVIIGLVDALKVWAAKEVVAGCIGAGWCCGRGRVFVSRGLGEWSRDEIVCWRVV